MPPSAAVTCGTRRTSGVGYRFPSESKKIGRSPPGDVKGSGRNARVEGFNVGGKTGTADKVVNGRYASDKNFNAFLAAFPIDDPRFVILVTLDEPKGTRETHGYATAGWVSAPTVRTTLQRVGPLLGIPPAVPNGAANAAILQANARPLAKAER